jgi:ribosomal-protein-alanine N-acetyltransferase
VDESNRTKGCQFQTARMDVAEWHTVELPGSSLAEVVAQMLTPSTTRALPGSWQGTYDLTRAGEWIRQRDAESTTLLVTNRGTATPVGVMVLFQLPGDPGHVDLRLGYLLAEPAWGKGVATELVAGFVDWCRAAPHIRSIVGGVDTANIASARVLIKNGFTPTGLASDGEQMYSLDLD